MKKLLFSILIFLFLLTPSVYGEIKILFLGDSITAGLGVMREESYPYLIDRMLKKKGHKVRIYNGSISGSTSASALSRLKWFKRVKADILVLALGANDGLRGQPVKSMEKNLEKTVVFAKRSGMKVIVAGMKMPPNYGKKYTDDFEKVFFNLAKKHKTYLIPFLLEGVGGNPELNQADGIHPNKEGQKIIADNVIKYILELL